MRRLLIGSCLMLAVALLAGRAVAAEPKEEIAQLVAKLKEAPNPERMAVEWGRLSFLVSTNKGTVKALTEFLTNPKTVKPAADALSGSVLIKPWPGVEDAIPDVVKALRDPACAGARFPLLAFLNKIDLKGNKEVYDVLLEIIKDDGVKSGIKAPQLKVHRDTAIRTLGKLGPSAKGATEMLCAMLKEALTDKRGGDTIRATVTALGAIDADDKEVLPLIRPLMNHENSSIAQDATRTFLQLNKDKAESEKLISELVAICKDLKNKKRFLVFMQLKEMGPVAKTAVPGLLDLMDDYYERERVVGIIKAVGPAGKDVIVPAVMKRIKDKDIWPKQFTSLYGTLMTVGADKKDVVAVLSAVLNDLASPEGKYPVKGTAQPFQKFTFEVLRNMGRDAAPAAKSLGAVVRVCITKGGADILQPALECLMKLGPDAKPAQADLQALVESMKPGTFHRTLAEQALKNMDAPSTAKVPDPAKPGDKPMPGDKPKPGDTPKVVETPKAPEKHADPELLKGLGGKDEAARAKVLAKLHAMGAEALPTLQEGLKADAADVRARAAGALGKLKDKAKEAVPALIEALKDRSPEVRREAAAALAVLGPDARDAEVALTDLLQDSDRETRLLAAYALEKIQGK